MRELILDAEVRTQLKKHSNVVRRSGKVPGVFYLHGEENIPISVIEKNLNPLIYTSETHIINLKLNDGKSKNCILRDVQYDPVTDMPIHFDLQGLKDDEEISIEVPVVITGGTPVGVRDGGVLQQLIYKLKVSCLPKFIPEHIEINVENLKINSFVHASDIKMENVTIMESPSASLVGVMPPTVEKEATAAVPGAEEAVEPEVIGKGKKVEEGAEGEGKPEAPAKAAPAAKEEKK
ncbi:MAG: 50S ribosomal protein L25 [Ignavibacteriales bacterium]|nr:50S ribosomal protein L25 [Ignavibacteriales bacterium]